LEELTFYSKYHSEWRNVIVHVIFVPTLVWTAMVWMAYVPPISTSLRPFGHPLNFAHLLATAYTVFHLQCDPVLGALASLLWWAMATSATGWVASREGTKKGTQAKASWARGTCAKYAGLLHIFSWYMQLHPGHAVFEGRKPALLDGMYQSFSVAPLFVFYEGAFALGYKPDLAKQVHSAVEAERRG
jgi:uncharacterized membrane protein YGL010W